MTIFDFPNYKDYLAERANERGSRAAWADAMGCQRGYVTSVLNGSAHLSLEQAESLARFLGFDEAEFDFFLILVQKDRAGTPQLKKHFQDKINQILKTRSELRGRYKESQILSLEQKMVFYSSWYIPAVHLCVSVGIVEREEIGAKLGIPVTKVNEAFQFLQSTGFIVDGPHGKPRAEFIETFLSDPRLITRHHLNWRIRALQAVEANLSTDIHFSSVFSVAKEDYEKVRTVILESVDRFNKTVAMTKDEKKVACFTVDLFDLFAK